MNCSVNQNHGINELVHCVKVSLFNPSEVESLALTHPPSKLCQ